jgi:hypothetical protein
MEEVIVEVTCPATAKKYEFRIPKEMRVGTAVKRIAEDIMGFEANNDLFDFGNGIILYDYDSRSIVNDGYTVVETGIRSGANLMIL